MMKEVDKKTQEKYLQLQMIDNQLQQLQKEIESINLKKQELNEISNQIDEFKNIKKNTKAMAQIGPGIHAESKITNTKEFLVNVGAGIWTRKSLPEVKKVLKKQVVELENAQNELAQNLQIMNIQAQMIQSQLQKDLGVE